VSGGVRRPLPLRRLIGRSAAATAIRSDQFLLWSTRRQTMAPCPYRLMRNRLVRYLLFGDSRLQALRRHLTSKLAGVVTALRRLQSSVSVRISAAGPGSSIEALRPHCRPSSSVAYPSRGLLEPVKPTRRRHYTRAQSAGGCSRSSSWCRWPSDGVVEAPMQSHANPRRHERLRRRAPPHGVSYSHRTAPLSALPTTPTLEPDQIRLRGVIAGTMNLAQCRPTATRSWPTAPPPPPPSMVLRSHPGRQLDNAVALDPSARAWSADKGEVRAEPVVVAGWSGVEGPRQGFGRLRAARVDVLSTCKSHLMLGVTPSTETIRSTTRWSPPSYAF